MKLTKTKILCLLLTGLMLFSLTACGKDKNPDLIKLGEYELHYKGACIMEDSDGNDAIVLKLDFTNNSKESASYLWSVSETALQNGAELEVATVYTDYNTYASTADNQFEAVEPGATLEIQTAFVLNDATNKVEVSFEQIFGKKNGKITVEPSELSRVEAAGAAAAGGELTTTPASSGDALLDWWNGEWYGWWKMTGCSGYYESMEGKWWDVCGVIDVGADHLGTVTLWDEDYTKAEPMASASVSLSEAGTGEHGTMMSEGGWFTDGASHVTGVDISEDACAIARRNAELNGLNNVEFVAENAFDLLRRSYDEKKHYDVIILDPPAFTKTRQALSGALRGYKEINLRAMKMLPKGGYLVTCSCSQHVSPEAFTDMLLDAARDAHRQLRLIESRTQGKDHPILLAAPETRYLKFMVFQVF